MNKSKFIIHTGIGRKNETEINICCTFKNCLGHPIWKVFTIVRSLLTQLKLDLKCPNLFIRVAKMFDSVSFFLPISV